MTVANDLLLLIHTQRVSSPSGTYEVVHFGCKWMVHSRVQLDSGCVGNLDALYGVGRLSGAAQIHLRLERSGASVRALCSADGRDWYTVGAVEFPVDDLVQVGPLAIGMIHRYVHAGAWPEGSAIRFKSLELKPA